MIIKWYIHGDDEMIKNEREKITIRLVGKKKGRMKLDYLLKKPGDWIDWYLVNWYKK